MRANVVLRFSLFVYCAIFVDFASNCQELAQQELIDGLIIMQALGNNGEWCHLSLDAKLFVIRSARLAKPLATFMEQIRDGKHNLVVEKFGYSATQSNVRFFSAAKEEAIELGSFGFWGPKVGDRMYLRWNRGDGYLLVPQKFQRQLLVAIEKVALDVDFAIESLETSDPRLLKLALEALTQECFRPHKKKVLSRMEPHLKHKEDDIRRWAARMILEIEPTHSHAQGILENKK